MTEEKREFLGSSLNRRDFVKTSALLGTGAVAATQFPWLIDAIGGNGRREIKPTAEYTLAKPESTIYTVCLNCHTACSMQAKIKDGVLVKLNGNPYSPMNLLPHVSEDTPLAEAATIDSKLCPKGQASIQTLYDPYRLRKVLKRVGPRGSGKWQTIAFDQAIDEVVNGGDLFGEGPVPGLKDIFVLRDADLSKEMAADVKAIESGEMTVAEFKRKHAANLDVLIDPDHPDLGPKNNQFVYVAGRAEHGRKELDKRFTRDSFGSVNRIDHTSICEQSHHIAYKLMNSKGKTHLKPDVLNSEFVIYFGASPFDATFGPVPMVEKMTKSLVERNFKYAVVDPRLSKTAAKAWRWLPVKPGMGDAAIGLGMIRWIIENERYDKTFLENPNLDAAKEDGESNSTDATHLVRTDEMVFLAPEDAGLEVPPVPEGEEEEPQYVVKTEDGLALHSQAASGQLEVDTRVNGIPVKSVFTLLRERAQEKTMEEYAELAGVSVDDIVELANELTSHGKKAVVESYRGPCQHTNGYYTIQALNTLNLLIGNVDHKGGLMVGGGHWHEDGSKDGAPFPLSDIHPGKLKKFGVPINREGKKYDKSTLFDRDGGFPAQRPWYPLTSNVYQEVIPAAGAAYPYPIKALWVHKGTPVLASPGGHTQIEILKDTTKIPLFITDDIVIGETSMYADYIFPDITYPERWATPHTTPDVATKISKIRQPTVAPIPETVVVDGEEMPICMESVMIAIGKKLGLPGFGAGGFGEGGDFNRPEDWYLKLAANLAFGDKEDGSEKLPAASDEEFRVFRAARAHLPPSVFDEEKWKAAVGEELWPSVVYLLNRGGRFEAADKAYDGDMVKHKIKTTWHLFVEKTAKIKDSITGERWDGLPRVEPVRHSTGTEYTGDGYEFNLITYKEIFGGHSRTISNYWSNIAMQAEGENFVIINKADGERLGIGDGDKVKLVSATNPDGVWPIGNGQDREMVAKAKRVEGMRPGVAAASWHFGHWAYGSNDVEIDGETIKGDDRRGKGVCPNAAMILDEGMETTCLTDPIGGSSSFYDTKVNLVKV
jgi:anaerobic selenocysteine-containing dehydrogenase